MSELKRELLITKTRLPSLPLDRVPRSRLSNKLVEALNHRLVLISAPAGYGKTTLVTEALRDYKKPIGWISLDAGDNTPGVFWNYFIMALQSVIPGACQTALNALQSPQPPPWEWLLTTIINSISSHSSDFTLVLDDYHNIESPAIHEGMSFLIEHLPRQVHLVIASRIDPPLPLARWRVKGEFTEIRAADLRFTSAEAAEFLNRVMGLNLSTQDMAALDNRTEGWIAGLQLAAIAMRGNKNTSSFIKSFTGSHHFVLDYLLEEVLQKQSESVRNFLLRTSILSRLCGPLCDAILLDPSAAGQETLEYLEHANLFIVPLDNERRWYRYHHLFADLLRQRLFQRLASSPGVEGNSAAELHRRARQWYEDNGLAFEAFHHATAANDIEGAERLIESREMDLHFRSVTTVVLDWLNSLPEAVLDAHPQLWVRSAGLALITGQTIGTEEKLQAAEKALQNIELDNRTRDLIGRIACVRATLALTRYQPEAMITQSRRALEYLQPDNLTSRFTANWALGTALMFQGDRTGAIRARQEGMVLSQKSGNVFSIILATAALGKMQELDNQLHQASEIYHRSLQLSGDYPQPSAGEVHLGLARIYYEWNDLEAAEHHGRQGLQLTRQWDGVIDRFIVSEVFFARLKLARGDVDGAVALLAEAEQSARQQNFLPRLPEIAAVQVPVLIPKGQEAAAAQLARQYELPLSLAQVFIVRNDPSAALAVLGPFRQQMETKGWADERLKAMVLQAVALHAHDKKEDAFQLLGEALTLAQPGGFIRLFVDAGDPMRLLLWDFRSMIEKQGQASFHYMFAYVNRLLDAFPELMKAIPHSKITNQNLNTIEPLSEREMEVLRLLRSELNGPEIAQQLIVSLNTLRTHTKSIYNKLGVNNRRAAVHRAEGLNLI